MIHLVSETVIITGGRAWIQQKKNWNNMSNFGNTLG